jgi:hypothetical protein
MPNSKIPQMPPINQKFQYQQSQQQMPMTQLEREAQIRNAERRFVNKSQSELNRVSNKLYNDNQPTRDYPNHSYWFGRTGPANIARPAVNNNMQNTFSSNSDNFYNDVRRRNLDNSLENRSPRQAYPLPGDVSYKFVNSPDSNHRNFYEQQLQMK